MTEAVPPQGKPPEPVADPDLPERSRRLLREAERYPSRYSGGRRSPWWAAAPVIARAGVVAAGAALLWLAVPADQPRKPQADGVPAGLSEALDEAGRGLFTALHSGIERLWPLAVTALTIIVSLRVMETASYNSAVQELHEARVRYVRPAELTEDARTLLARAQQARRTVLGSSVHRRDLVDRQRNQTALPHQEWEIAEALREYSRLTKAEPDIPRSSQVAEVIDVRRQSLAASFRGIGRRVVALERYADQVRRADDRFQELQQIQQLTESSTDVLELLARTVRDDLAVAEIEGMSVQAAAVAAAFTAALESAKEAAAIALPAITEAA
ncbi:hypothetical protein [Streptomyces sp. NPDC091416]|uniref:hypothetical protein n=1 Tax=Streptomyces sp. NPDC091416 TaxID=3366003 RepID=UPI00382408EB